LARNGLDGVGLWGSAGDNAEPEANEWEAAGTVGECGEADL